MSLGADGGKAQWRERVAAACCLLMMAAAYARLWFGVDFTDEAFYSALPHAFSLGLKPYAEELNVTQNAGILLAPIYRIFTCATGGTDGVVLFNRHLFFAALCGCAWLAWRGGRRWAGAESGRWAGAFVFGFSYFNIPALSYNTLGALFLFAGVFLSLEQAVSEHEARAWLRIGGANLCWVAMAFSYPTLILAAAAGFAMSLWLAWRARAEGSRGIFFVWVLTLAVGVAGAAVFWRTMGADGIREVLAYAASYGYAAEGSGLRKVAQVAVQSGCLLWHVVAVAAWFAFPLLPARWFREGSRILPLLALVVGGFVAALGLRESVWGWGPTAATPIFLVMGLALPVLIAAGRFGHVGRKILFVGAIPGALAAAAVAWSSTNGLVSAMIGLFPMATVSVALVVAWAREIDADLGSGGGGRSAAATSALLCLSVFLMFSLLGKSYRDEARPGAGGLVSASGPYAGIFTTEERAEKVFALRGDFARVADEGGTLFTPDDFPAAYLFSSMRPRTFSVWPFWSGVAAKDEARLRGVLEPAALAPDWVLREGAGGGWIDSELERRGYRAQLERDDLGYIFWRRVEAEVR